MKIRRHVTLYLLLGLALVLFIGCKGKIEYEVTENSSAEIAPGKKLHVHFQDSTDIELENHGRILFTDNKTKEGKLEWSYEEVGDTATANLGIVLSDDSHSSTASFTFTDVSGDITGQTVTSSISGPFSGFGLENCSTAVIGETIGGSSFDPFASWDGKTAVLGNFSIESVSDSGIEFCIDTSFNTFAYTCYQYLYSDNIYIIDSISGMREPLLMYIQGEGNYSGPFISTPSLSEWALIILALLLLVLSVWIIVRKNRSVSSTW